MSKTESTARADQAIVLVHGLWMSRWSFASIARYFKNLGYRVYSFGYKSTTKPFEFNQQKLQAFINSRKEQTVHLVVHSMGGILSMRTLPVLKKQGKLIMLGSPVNGSQAAQEMGTKKWTSWMLKYATEPLENGVVNPQAFRQSLMIAGTSNWIGIARIVTRLPEPNDGTVALIETQANWINQHKSMKTNHFRMLFHKKIKQTMSDFLINRTEEKHEQLNT
jgi:triacylglycerol esterase/lipase EstA (alpha/beta hydrolase family)